MWKKIKHILKRKLHLRKKLNRSINSTELDMEELKEKVSKGAILIDVRSLQEYNEGHLDSAISIPEYELRYKG